MKNPYRQSLRSGFAPLLVIGLVAIIVFIAFVTFGPFSASGLGQLSLRQEQQESHAALPPEGGSGREPWCYFRLDTHPDDPIGYGDLNNDKLVNSADALIVQRISVGLTFEAPYLYGNQSLSFEAADVSDTSWSAQLSKKSAVNAIDSLLIQRYTAKLIETMPVCSGRPKGDIRIVVLP